MRNKVVKNGVFPIEVTSVLWFLNYIVNHLYLLQGGEGKKIPLIHLRDEQFEPNEESLEQLYSKINCKITTVTGTANMHNVFILFFYFCA